MDRLRPSRRGFGGVAFGMAAALTGALHPAGVRAAAAGPSTSDSQPIVETPQGRLAGAVARPGVLAFKGIPYGAPPVGERRWKAADPAPGWDHVRDAGAFGPQAVQVGDPETAFFALPQAVQSEDCLYLNVWTPEAGEGGRPVMVWIHGGAFISGAGSIPAYDGAALARKGVVVVTLNYRVGVLGYFTHPELVAEAGGGVAANFGTTDQIQALRWVQRNIAAFGGDPGNVTIFGESAGAMSVCQLLASPLAKGLFHRAIGQSGGFFFPMREIGRPSWGGPPAEEITAAFARRIGAPALADLRRMPAQNLAKASVEHAALLGALGAGMVVDGVVFPRQVHETFRRGEQHAVPVLLGFNEDEGSGIADYGAVPVIADPALYEATVRERYGRLADDYLALYPAADPQGSAFDAFRDGAFGWHMMEWANLTAGVSRDAYLYYFTHAPPGADQDRRVFAGPTRRRVGAHHASEILYAFNNVDRPLLSVWGDGVPHANRPYGPPRPADIRLADAMSDYWVAFARSGAPAVPGRPAWRPYTRSNPRYMGFGEAPEPAVGLLPGMWRLNSRINAAREAASTFWYVGNVGLNGPALESG
jgi:para-nitrobenzyl esterase